MIERFLACLEGRGWTVERCPEPQGLPEEILDRYQLLPALWRELISAARCVVSGDETAWFLCAEDYSRQGDQAWQWDEWERMSLEAAEGDEGWQREIKAFWDAHLPILMSVGDGYAYCALSMESGAVVCGREAEFEECTVLAASFAEFAEKLVRGCNFPEFRL